MFHEGLQNDHQVKYVWRWGYSTQLPYQREQRCLGSWLLASVRSQNTDLRGARSSRAERDLCASRWKRFASMVCKKIGSIEPNGHVLRSEQDQSRTENVATQVVLDAWQNIQRQRWQYTACATDMRVKGKMNGLDKRNRSLAQTLG
jgi:hypothetical protein